VSLRVQDLKKNDRVKDSEDTYRCLEDPVFIDGVWQIRTVTGGEYDYMLKDDPNNPIEWDDFWIKIKERRKAKTQMINIDWEKRLSK
jgi:hypothetical protein